MMTGKRLDCCANWEWTNTNYPKYDLKYNLLHDQLGTFYFYLVKEREVEIWRTYEVFSEIFLDWFFS